LVCAAVIAFQQAAQHSSALSDAGNWAAITAAVFLVVGSLLGWFYRVSHSLYVVGETVGLHVGGPNAGELEIVPGIELFNSAGIALGYEIVSFRVSIGTHPDRDFTKAEGREYVAPQQKRDWHGDRESVPFSEFPLQLVARYEVQYGRKSRLFWWWRRSIRGNYRAELPFPAGGEPMTLLSEQIEGPPTDTRVPLTSLGIGGWRL
jgi:hypothetical protein